MVKYIMTKKLQVILAERGKEKDRIFVERGKLGVKLGTPRSL
jgi:hypothetical protein